MLLLNRIVLIGRLTRDPELRYTSNGTPVCNFTLAVERNYTNRNGDRDVDFINIVTWRGLAEIVPVISGRVDWLESMDHCRLEKVKITIELI